MPPVKAGKTKAPKSKKPKKEESDDDIDQSPPSDHRDDEIARLQEQVRLLTIEVDTLRKHVGKISPQVPKTPAKAARAIKAVETPVTPKARRASVLGKPKEKGCTCKGSCSNKICGCVKKDLYCMPTCKCSDQCQNQDPGSENEDKENNRANGTIEASDSGSSPEQNDKQNNGNNSNTNTSSPETNDEADFNPMKPRKQLLRSPVSKSSASGSKTASKPASILSHPALNEIPLPQPPKQEPEDELPPPEEINEAEVDWEKHKSQLVPCSKCKRNFFRHRLKKHENSCKKI